MTTPTRRQLAKPKVILWPDGKAAGRIDLSPYVTSFRYNKAMSQPSGSWSVSLLPSQGANLTTSRGRGPGHYARPFDIERVLQPNSIITIGMDRPGGIAIGLTDDPQTSRRRTGGPIGAGITLSGSDFGKILAQDHIVHASLTVAESAKFFADVGAVVGPDNAMLAALPGVFGPTNREGVPTFLGESPQTVIDWLVRTCPSMQFPLLACWGGTGRPRDFLKVDANTTWNNARIFSEAPHTFQGTLWDFVRSILDEDFYELFIDSIPDPLGGEIPEMHLTVRPKPYDEAALQWLPTQENTGATWEALKTRIDGFSAWEIPESEVYDDSLGVSDSDVYSYYLVTADHELIGNPDALAEGLFYPSVDLAAIRRHGLRSMEARLSLVAGDVVSKQEGTLDYDTEVGAEVQEYRNRLFNWYRGSDYFEAGSITVAGRDNFRIGDPVSLPWRTPARADFPGARYYCCGTTHAWSVGGGYTTTLRLIRGHNASLIQRLNEDIAAAGAPYGNPKMLAFT